MDYLQSSSLEIQERQVRKHRGRRMRYYGWEPSFDGEYVLALLLVAFETNQCRPNFLHRSTQFLLAAHLHSKD